MESHSANAPIIHLNDLQTDGLEETSELLASIRTEICLTFVMRDAYAANSIAELADSWLKTWYIAETVGASGTLVSYTMNEQDRGEALISIVMENYAAPALAHSLHDLAPCLDPDDLESDAWLSATASDWLEKRPTDMATQFPDIEDAYRTDAARAS